MLRVAVAAAMAQQRTIPNIARWVTIWRTSGNRGAQAGGLDRDIAHALPPSRLVKNPRDMLPRVLRPLNFNTLIAFAKYGAQHCQSLSPRARDWFDPVVAALTLEQPNALNLIT